jgi:hypothetical protein
MRAFADGFRSVRLALACASAALSLSIADAAGQTEGNQLRGATKFQLMIQTQRDAGVDACGVTEDRIREAFMFPASGAKFGLGETPLTIHIVSLVTDLKDGRCATHIRLPVYFAQVMTPPYAKASIQEEWSCGSATCCPPRPETFTRRKCAR